MLNIHEVIFFAVLSLLFFCQTTIAQKVEVNNERLISAEIDYPLSEPHLIIDPNDPDHLMVAAILTEEWKEGESSDSYIVLLQSWNGGKAWSEKHFDEHIEGGADPWLAMNNRNTLVLTSLNRIENKRGVSLLAFVSPDGGRKWNDQPLNLGLSHDRQSIVVDPRTQNFIIVSAQQNYSVDRQFVWGLKVTRLVSNGTLREAVFHPLSNIDKNNGGPRYHTRKRAYCAICRLFSRWRIAGNTPELACKI